MNPPDDRQLVSCGFGPFGIARRRSMPFAVAAIGLVLSCCEPVVAERPSGSTPPSASAGWLGPESVLASPDGNMIYVAHADAREVAWVDLRTREVVRRAKVPHRPHGMALSPDGLWLVVGCAAPKSQVVVFDTASGKQLGSIAVGHTATGVAISPDGKIAYVCNRFSGDVSVVDLEARRETERFPAEREPVDVAVTPDGRTLLIANHLPNTRTDIDFKGNVAPLVHVVDLSSGNAATIELPHGANGVRNICIMPDGRHALVPHMLSNFEQIPFRVDTGWINTNVLSVIDLEKRDVVATIGMDQYGRGAGNPWDVVCTADGRWVCVTLSGTHEVALITASELLGDFARRTMQPMMAVWPIYVSLGESLWRRKPLPGKGPRGATVAGSKLVVAEYFSDTLAVVDPETVKRGSGYDGPGYGTIDDTSEPTAAEQGNPAETIALGPRPTPNLQRRGEMLFNDATICYQHWQSCASCHPDGRADGLNWDLLNDGPGNSKNTKSMLVSHQTPPSMGEGVRATAEVAVRSGLTHILFAARPEEEAVAIDAYLKSLQPVPSPYLVDGQFSESAERGRALFESDRIGCYRCHPAPLYTDMKQHGMPARQSWDRGKRFDTPTLIEVWRTAPYLHDGRYATLWQLLVEGKHGLSTRRLEKLTDQELDDLIEFVRSL